MDLTLIKLPNGCLAAYGEDSQEQLAKVKTGALLHGKTTRMRNPQFHRKFFALTSLAFDIWCETVEPMEYKGHPVKPSRDNFRRDVTILAGHYNSYVNLKGEVRLEAKSISFANMDEDEFEALYGAFIDVILTKVLRNPKYTREVLDEHVERIMSFDR